MCPKQEYKLPIEHAPEKRKNATIFYVHNPKPNQLLERFSKYERLIRFTCHSLRWLTKSKSKSMPSTPIDAIEFDAAETKWICMVQREHFGHEIGRLKEKRGLPKQSTLTSLTPFVDRANPNSTHKKHHQFCRHILDLYGCSYNTYTKMSCMAEYKKHCKL